ncbi:MAG: thiamine-binding protein [Acidimicrobiia bacterium]|nr:thiamine-binding protein [Acidimicrobiia bacterium]
MANAMMNIQIIPKVSAPEDLYPAVDAAIAIVQDSGLPYEVGGLGTTLEGDFDTLLGIAKEMNEEMIRRGCTSVISQVRLYLGAEPISMDGLTAKFKH